MGRRKGSIFDDVFRTICERLPHLLIPLINETFGTEYPMNAKLVQLKNDHHLSEGRIVTDAYIKINGDAYHIECQSNDMQIMIVRMFEYDVTIALEGMKKTKEGFEIMLPKPCVVYLRGKNPECYVKLSELIVKVSDYVCGKKNAVKKGVRDAMGGKVLKLHSDKIREEGKKEGESLLGKLVIKLMSLGKNDDVVKVSSDVKYREKLYTLYGIK